MNVCIQVVEISCCVLYRRNIMYYHGYLFVCEGACLSKKTKQCARHHRKASTQVLDSSIVPSVGGNSQVSPLPAAVRVFVSRIIDGIIRT